MNNLKKIIFIVGPTAVGKSQAALFLARRIEGEIISCDSMQVYKEINIANDKPLQEVLAAVPHHLINIVSVEEVFDVEWFNTEATRVIKDIHNRGHIPVIVGGSGLYMQVLLDGIFQGAPRNEELRKDLERLAKKKGNEFIHQQLQKKDPQAALKIHPHNLKKMIRALEVCVTAKQPISILQKNRQGIWGKYDIRLVALNRDREELYQRINQRVERMFQEGLVDEIKDLDNKKWGRTADGIIGVNEVRDYLKGHCDLEQAIEQTQLNTRHFAKRQLTWFRKEERLQWIFLKSGDTPEDIANQIYEMIVE